MQKRTEDGSSARRRSSALNSGVSFSFAHLTIGKSVEELMTSKEQGQLHAVCASALTEQLSAGALARHYDLAHLPWEAAKLYSVPLLPPASYLECA